MDRPEAPEPTPEEAAVTHLRATLLRGLHKDTLRRGGEGAWLKLVSTLSPEGRSLFRELPGSLTWVPVERVNELAIAYADFILGHGHPGLGGATAEDQFTVVHAWLLKLLNPGLLVRQIPMIFGVEYRGGVVRIDFSEPGRAQLSAWVTGLFPEWYTHATPRWLTRGLELSGGRRCAVVHHPPESGHRHVYELSWEP
jgi:hypothetical protein